MRGAIMIVKLEYESRRSELRLYSRDHCQAMYADGRFSRQLLSGPDSDTRSFKLMGVEARELLAQFHLPLPLRRLLSFSKVYLDAYTGLWMHSSSSSFSTCGCRTATMLTSVGPPAATSLHFTTNVTCEFLAQFCVSHHYVQTHLRFRLLYLVLALERAFLNRLLLMYVVVGDERGDGRLSMCVPSSESRTHGVFVKSLAWFVL